MKTISDVINLFNINLNELQLSSDIDLLIDLNNNWFDADSYQIKINNTIRDIDINKVSKCGLVLFIDATTSQITVVSLKNNLSSQVLKYVDHGNILFKFQSGKERCSVVEFKDSKLIVFTLIRHKNTPKIDRLKTLTFTNSDADKIIVEELFKKELSLLY